MNSFDLINLTTSLMTPVAIMMGLMVGWRFLRNYELNQAMQREELKFTRIREEAFPRENKRSTNITIAGDPTTSGGYDFIQVPDDFKPIFLDAMNGFCDYAKLKGYSVELSTDSSHPDRVGVRFTIVDIGVTVSTAKVRHDVDEYLRKFKDDDDLSDMPMPENPAEHAQLKAALRSRFAYVHSKLEIMQIKNDFLLDMLNGIKSTGLPGIRYDQPNHSQTLHVTLQNDGGKNMGDSYTTSNSQNIAQGKGASATTTGSTIQIGSNHDERQIRIQALKDFAHEAKTSNLPEPVRAEVDRYIENARDELATSENPDPDEVEKWLKRADKAIDTAAKGTGLAEKITKLLVLFGIS